MFLIVGLVVFCFGVLLPSFLLQCAQMIWALFGVFCPPLE